MSPEEFILWLKGFTEGVHEFNVSPKQWDNLKEKLASVVLTESKTSTDKQLLRDSAYNYTLRQTNGKLQ